MKDELGDRMKLYEKVEAGRTLIPLLPTVARLDGRSFHKFCKHMNKPFDSKFSDAMIDTAKFLCVETNASIAYVQSDEISLAWHIQDIKQQLYFGGRIFKIVSQLAAQASVRFNAIIDQTMPELGHCYPTFDARVCQLPNRREGANVFAWRELDASKNSVSAAASHYYSHDELHGKSSSQKQEMLYQKGINWNDYHPHFKRGTFVQRKIVVRAFCDKEKSLLSDEHKAHTDPDLKFERSELVIINPPPFGTIVNKVDFVFEGAEPITLSQGKKDEN